MHCSVPPLILHVPAAIKVMNMVPVSKALYVFVFTIGLFGSTAHSAMGIPVDPAELPGQVCAIEFYDQNSRLTQVCSATLITPETLLTAAHCLDKEPVDLKRHIVKCPNGEVRVFTKHRFSKRYPGLAMMGTDRSQRRFDAAVVTLERPVALPGMTLVTSLTEAERLIAKVPYCAIFGYGGSNLDDPNSIRLTGAKVNPSSIRIESHKPIVIDAENTWYSGLVEPGDSGGPLACLLDKGRGKPPVWILVGNISGRDLQYHSFIAPFAVNEELLKGVPAQTNKEAQEGEIKFRTQQLRQALINRMERAEPLFTGRNAEKLVRFKVEVYGAENEETLREIERRFDFEVRALLPEFIGYRLRIRSFARVTLNFSSPEMIELQYPAAAAYYIPDKNPFSIADEPINWLTITAVEDGFVYGDLAHFGYGGVFPCRGSLVCHAGTFRRIKVAIEDLRLETLRQ